MNILILCLLMGQTQLPHELDKTQHYLSEMTPGQHLRVAADALAVDEYGRVWLRSHYIFSHDEKYARSLEVICTRIGYAVIVHPIYHGDRYIYPKWERAYVPRPWDIPVRSISVEMTPNYRGERNLR